MILRWRCWWRCWRNVLRWRSSPGDMLHLHSETTINADEDYGEIKVVFRRTAVKAHKRKIFITRCVE